MTFGVVLYAKDDNRVADFYAGLLATAARVIDGAVTVESNGFQIVVVRVPDEIASAIQVLDPPVRRTDTPVKMVLPVPSNAAAREAAARLGGVVDAVDYEWRFGSHLVCDGNDPEGNVFQLRQIDEHG